ncbi:MAG: thioredoxin domain-containing protein [Pseudomonadota bacterium]
MKPGYAVFGFVVVGALCFYVGYQAGANKAQGQGAPTAANRVEPTKAVRPTPIKQADAAGDIFNIPVGSAACKGPADAKVTIIEFSDFQCPFCSRVGPTIEEVFKTYGNDVRFCFKNNPLPFHGDADLAAQAANAAGEQGKFFEMHDKLFANQKALKREDLERYGQELQLDMAKFKAALDDGRHKAAIERDKAEAARFGARGTPAFFVNGAFLSGAQPFPAFKEKIDDAIKRADEALAKGASKSNVYAEVVKNGKDKAAPPAPPQARPGEGTGRQLVSIPSHTSCKGPKDAKVTIVEFSDFECPFCSRVVPTMDKILDTYKKDVRFCFRNNPLPFHNNAMPAAMAAMAAGEQGKFFEMHDKLFANQKALTRADLDRYAQEIGLNTSKFKAAMDNSAFKAQIEQDQKDSASVGARGTPSFFINGTKIAGAQPFESFQKLIDEDIKLADAELKKGTPLAKVYEALVKADPFKAGAPAAAPGEPADDGKPVNVDIKGAYTKGPKNAKVTIVEFSEFQCPFCSRVKPTVDQIMKDYQGKVQFAFKHNPLPFHNNAEDASKAALAAGEQGKFWEMHDKLFDNQKALGRPDLERYAQEIGLNMSKFKADLDNPKLAGMIAADKAEAAKVGARGTPTFFINGRRLVGAQPVENFKKMIDEELKSN